MAPETPARPGVPSELPRGATVGRLSGVAGGRAVGDLHAEVDDVTHDSREARPGMLFAAVPGMRADGHGFVPDAIARGASAVMVERELDVRVPQIVVPSVRDVLALVAAEIHGHPSAFLRVVGVTGTNGKTTVTHLLASIAAVADIPHGVVGTLGARIGDEAIPLARTTPESTDLQRLLRRMLDRGVDVVGAEVSSHAIELGRVDAVSFAAVAFTNLSQDHLDFHGDMESYYRTKAQLFDEVRARVAVVWVDDPYGRRLAEEAGLTVLRAGFDGGDVSATEVETGPGGSRFRLRLPDGEVVVDLPLVGRFNVANATVAAGLAHVLGIGRDGIAEGLRRASTVRGRFEPVAPPTPDRPTVVVDYAHTPAGIAEAIDTARRLTDGEVIAVVGAGGDRDRGKRPAMGEAGAGADLLVVTSDNPRSEDPLAIIDEILRGVPSSATFVIEPDRARAIEIAIGHARPGDLVLILGKGHETGQEIAGRVLPFDDREVARRVLDTWSGRQEVDA